MEPRLDRPCTAFAGNKQIATGDVREVVKKLKDFISKDSKSSILIFDDLTSAPIEINLRLSTDKIIQQLEETSLDKKMGPGRPRLGVISKEVTLLPEHWEWLAIQPGGASGTLRRMIEVAKKKNEGRDQLRQAQEATYKFMTAMAGDLPGYEEALRALYAKDLAKFKKLIGAWPSDISAHVKRLSKTVFQQN